MKKLFLEKRVVWYTGEVAAPPGMEKDFKKPEGDKEGETKLNDKEAKLAEDTSQRVEKVVAKGKLGEAHQMFKEKYDSYKKLDAKEAGVVQKRETLVRFLKDALKTNGTDAGLQKAFDAESKKIDSEVKLEKSHLDALRNAEELKAFQDYMLKDGINTALREDRRLSDWRERESHMHTTNMLNDSTYAAKWNASLDKSGKINANIQAVYKLRDAKSESAEDWYKTYKDMRGTLGQELISYSKFSTGPVVVPVAPAVKKETPAPMKKPPEKAAPVEKVAPPPVKKPEPKPQLQPKPPLVAKVDKKEPVIKPTKVETPPPEKTKVAVQPKQPEKAKEIVSDGTKINGKEVEDLLALYDRLSGAPAGEPAKAAGAEAPTKKVGEGGQKTQFEINTNLLGYNNLNSLKAKYGDIVDSWIQKIKPIQGRMSGREGLQLISLTERGNSQPVAKLLVRKMRGEKFRYYLQEMPSMVQQVDETMIVAGRDK